MQHGGIDEGRQFRLATDDVFRLGADAVPDRIERRQLRVLRIDLMHGHDAAPANSSASSRIIARRADGCPVADPAKNAGPPVSGKRWSGNSTNQAAPAAQ